MAAASTALQVFVSPLLGTLYDNLSPLFLEKIGLVWGVTKEMAKVSDILLTIRDILEDAEDKQITNKLISNWLRKFKDVAYDVEDLLDECATEAFGPQSRIIERATVAERIKCLINKFEEIAEERSRFHLVNLTSKTRDAHTGVSLQRETSSFPTELQVYGREKEKSKIVSLLVNNVAEGVTICNIVGMGGLGKTTLAKMIHNDERIVSHFQVRCWVCASKSFELKTLISAIMESLTGNAHHVQYLDTLLHRIQEILSGKRFLLVLDDVWNEDQAKWDALKSSLTCGASGSSIIVTTRLKTVASLTGNLYVCNLDFLSDKDCFSLFKNRAFMEGEGDCHPNLLSIGKEIVKKCGGLPLAAKALGGLLRFKREEQEWLFVRDSNIWDLPQDQEEAVLPSLRLSYNFLPSHLRQCFAYCSIFPKDYEMKRQVLIHLWMANGFVQPKGSMELEDIGNEIFNDLLWRSFFQDIYKDIDGNIAGCKMHYLVHDLACSITGNECCSIMDVGKEEIVGTSITRHLSIPDSCFSRSSSTDLGSFLSESHPILRTFLRLDHKLHVHVPPQLSFSNLTCLRVLDLSETQVTTLPVSLGLLKHLRYLDLSKTYITSLPDEIFCNLRNLQTLKLFGCNQLQLLPENLQNISNLRHLDITKCNKLTRMPVRMGQLKCLQTLSIFIVGKEIGHGIEELQGLDLRGELTIKLLKNVRNPINAKNANLIRKKNLCSLSLCWSNESLFEEINYSTEEDDEVIAESLQPHPNIKWLHLSFYNGVKFPSWMRNFTCLPSLVEISLDGCKRCDHLPSLGLLPHLKVLKMSGMNSLKCIGDEFYYGENDNMRRKRGLLLFPSLEELELRQMPHLEEWKGWSSSTSSVSPSTSEEKKEEVQVLAFPILKSLDIYGCPNLRTCHPLPLSIQRLSLWGCRDVILTISLGRLHQLSRLSSLTIGGFDELMSFPDEGVVLRQLSALKLLEIGFCPKLKTITSVLMEKFTALTYLRIWGCQELISLPDGMQNLTSLQSLNIYSCHGLKSLGKGLQHFPILNTLFISDCPELEFLPDDFQHLVALRHLKLGKLDKMTFLPVVRSQYPTGTLESIDIWCCRNLKFLPDGLKDLITLESLEIRDCHPDLHVRCQKTTGEDWHKIAHVPTIRIYLEIVNGV